MTRTNRDSGQPGFAMRLASGKDAPEAIRLALLAYLEGIDLSPQAINRVEVILEELVTNVVRHATSADTVLVEAEAGEQGLVLTIEDNGTAFNPLEVPEPSPFTSLESATLGGQGIPLIKRLSKQVHYQRIDGRNRMTTVIATS